MECKHYNTEKIYIISDGKTPPIIRCKDCFKILRKEKNN